MARRYHNCQFFNSVTSPCTSCSLSNYGRDCRNNPANGLIYHRELRGLTQEELGQALGMKSAQARISQWETGVYKPSAGTLLRIAQVLQCSIEDLLA